jgi:hypothetical protein
LPANRSLDARVDRPPKAAIADDKLDDTPPDEPGRDAASGGFDFRQLGQELAAHGRAI